MSPVTFEKLFRLVAPHIAHPRAWRSATPRRPEISPQERLIVTIRYLATGNSLASMAFEFRMGHSTVCGIIKETCAAIWEALRVDYVKFPRNEDAWRTIAAEFERKWNFPNCVGAIDGKHVALQAASNAG